MSAIDNFPDFPKRVVVELTNKCNLSCSYCPRQHIAMKEDFMDTGLFKHILDQCHEHSCDVIPFWRGEMFLHPEVDRLLTYAAYSVLNVYIATNGTTNHLLHLPLTTFDRIKSISLSLHKPTAINLIWKLNNRRTFETPHLQISTVEHTPSEHIIDGFDFPFLRPTDTVRKYKQHTINGEWGQVEGHIEEPNREHLCERLLTDLVIAWDGSISHCCYIWPTLKGNQNNANYRTLEQLWKESDLQKIRDEYPNDYCLPCDQWKGTGKTL